MAIDEALLEAHASYADREHGIAERFVRIADSGGWTVGVLSEPIGPARHTGWVISHSFGPEQMELQMTEVFLARGLARAGFPVLRFHGQGYGDSQHIDQDPDLSSHLRDTTQAVSQMQEFAHVEHVGLLGARLGGAVAAIVADRLALPHLALLSPAVSGKRFVAELLRMNRITEVAETGSMRTGDDSSSDARQALNVKGFMLTQETRQQLRDLDLTSLLERFDGEALVVQVSMGEKPNPRLLGLVDRLTELGAHATFKVASDPFAPKFGGEHMHDFVTGTLKDLLGDLNRILLATVLDWIRAQGEGPTLGTENAP